MSSPDSEKDIPWSIEDYKRAILEAAKMWDTEWDLPPEEVGPDGPITECK